MFNGVRRKTISSSLTVVAVLGLSFLTACSNTQSSNVESLPSPSVSTEQDVGVLPGDDSNDTSNKVVPFVFYSLTDQGAGIELPEEWALVSIPGADKGFLVSTAPGNQSVGFTKISPDGSSYDGVDENIVADTVQLLLSANPTSEVSEESVSFFKNDSGEKIEDRDVKKIKIVKGDKTLYAWIIERGGELFLVTLSSAYLDGKNGLVQQDELMPGASAPGVENPASEPVSEEQLVGTTAVEQVEYVLML